MKNLAFLLSLCIATAAAEGGQTTRHHTLRSVNRRPHGHNALSAHPRFADEADQRKAPFPDGYAESKSAAVPVPMKRVRNAHGNGDAFVAIYWGVVAIIFALLLGLAYQRKFPDAKIQSPLFRAQSRSVSSTEPLSDRLASSVWSLNLLAATGQAKYPNKSNIRPMSVLLVTLLMALLQVFALFLVVDSVDPAAKPITTVPTTPWKTAQHAWTVNSMKWVMVTFLGMSVVSEAGDAHKVFVNAFMIEGSRLLSWRVIPLLTSFCHYVITMGVVIVGVSVILCCQDVPSILYNSLAITFINQFDDTTHDFVEKVTGIECNFEIKHEVWDEPPWLEVVEHFVVLLPFLWAFFLIGRAWCTDQMPSVLLAWLLTLVNNGVQGSA